MSSKDRSEEIVLKRLAVLADYDGKSIPSARDLVMHQSIIARGMLLNLSKLHVIEEKLEKLVGTKISTEEAKKLTKKLYDMAHIGATKIGSFEAFDVEKTYEELMSLLISVQEEKKE